MRNLILTKNSLIDKLKTLDLSAGVYIYKDKENIPIVDIDIVGGDIEPVKIFLTEGYNSDKAMNSKVLIGKLLSCKENYARVYSANNTGVVTIDEIGGDLSPKKILFIE